MYLVTHIGGFKSEVVEFHWQAVLYRQLNRSYQQVVHIFTDERPHLRQNLDEKSQTKFNTVTELINCTTSKTDNAKMQATGLL